MADELVDIVDENGRILRQASKHDAHKNGWLHKSVVGYVRRADQWGLIRQTADKQDAHQWVAPIGGHVQTGETEIEALLREAEEEIGIRNFTHSHVGTGRFHRQVIGRDENHLVHVYEIQTDDQIILGEEVAAFEWLTTDKLKRLLQKTPHDFGDGYYFILEHFYPMHLPRSHVRRWS